MIKEVHAQTVDISGQYAFGGIKSLGEATQFLIIPIFQIASILLIFYFIWAVFRIITSGGDKETLAKERRTITHVIIGFILLIFMFLLLQFVPEVIGLKGYRLIK